ncbi:MAG: S-layer homology domain-containing protein, partial [Oscillospiraceae bacterium]
FLGFNLDVQALLDVRLIDVPTLYDGLRFEDDWCKEALDWLDPTVTLMASIKVSAGVGIARLAAIRAYIMGTIAFKYQPAVTGVFPDCPDPWGLMIKLSGGVQLDVVGIEIPFDLTALQPSWSSKLTYNVGLYDYMYKKFPPSVIPGTGKKEVASVSSAQSSDNSENIEKKEVQVKLKERASNAKWVANENADLKGGFEPIKSQTLQTDGFTQPDSQIMNIGGGRMLMVYLADSAQKANEEITSLMYSIYDNGVWSNPQEIQNDATGDYYPNLCSAGDKVMVSWSSANPANITNSNKEPLDAKIESLKATDIYSVLFDKASGTFGEIDHLTDDKYSDSKPIGVYDATTGDRTVYYIKNSGTSNSLYAFANPSGTVKGEDYTMICYMLYDGAEGRWLKDKYFDEEVDPADQAELIKTWKGQRFLASPIPGLSDPIIVDLAAAPGYNTLGVYAFTVDKDYVVDTIEDTELFIQVYDFETHKTYHPIRITNDNVAQNIPQLVRHGSGKDAKTYLFWLENQIDVKYIDVTTLIKEGVEDNGAIKAGYNLSISKVEMNLGAKEQGLSTYKAMVDDKNNLYVLWPKTTGAYNEEIKDELGNAEEYMYQEIYATALIEEETKAAAEGETVEVVDGTNWSKPYRLTTTEEFNDGVAADVDDSGNLMIVHNQFKEKMDEKSPSYFTISDMKLVATMLKPIGTVEVSKFEASTVVPDVGEKVTFTTRFSNNGLTTVNGFTTEFYEYKDNKQGALIHTVTSDERIVPNTKSTDYTFEYTVPKDFENAGILAISKENGYINTVEKEFKPLIKSTMYDLTFDKLEQVGDEYIAEYTVTNKGNIPAGPKESIIVEFAGPYASYEDYGLKKDEQVFAKESIAGLAPGEKKSFTSKLDVNEKVFDYCGFVDAKVQVYSEIPDKDGKIVKEPTSAFCFTNLKKEVPTHVKVNGEQTLNAHINSNTTLNTTYNVGKYMEKGDVSYEITDPTIASLDGNVIRGLKSGVTTLKVHVQPYGITKEIPLTVTQYNPSSGGGSSGGGNKPKPTPSVTPAPTPSVTPAPTEKPETVTPDGAPKFNDVKESDWFFEAASIAAKLGIMNGTEKDTFSPEDNLTRGMFATMLARYEGVDLSKYENSKFVDVDEDEYYSKAITWVCENEIATGINANVFAPDEEITREQLVTMMYRYAKFKGQDVTSGEDTNILSYDDSFDISSYAIPAMQWALTEDIIKGRTETTVNPIDNITRAETAQVILNYIRNLERKAVNSNG